MKKKRLEITDKAILETILKKSEICRIAMVDNGMPYLLPFNYGYKDNCIYIHAALTGKKMDVLAVNPNVCFEIEQKAEIVKRDLACRWTTTFRSIVGYGKIEIITDFEQKKRAMEIIMAHYDAPPEIVHFEEKHMKALAILKLPIDTMTGKQSSNWDTVDHEGL